jgi:NagD protein
MRHGFLIDMDGVLYRGDDLIAGADEFVGQLRVRNIPFRFLTNNSQGTRRDVVAKLARMGIEVEAANLAERTH